MKIHKIVCIDEDLLHEIQKKGFNFSSMTNEFWGKYLSEPQKYEEIKLKIRETQEEIEEKKKLFSFCEKIFAKSRRIYKRLSKNNPQ